MKNNNSMVTIITVCFNAEKTIEKAICSVMNQTYFPLEYVIIDGCSSDSTCKIIENYRKNMEMKNIKFHFISEKDNGIYNAMNKGVKMAQGQWIAFMNSDDCYCGLNSIEKVMQMCDEDTDVIYGNEIITKDNYKKKNIRNQDLTLIKKRLPFCHQSSFVKAEYLKKTGFNESYSLTADYDFFLKLYIQSKKFQYVDIDVSEYNANGASAKFYKQAINETYRTKVENGIINAHNPIYLAKKWYWIIRTTIDNNL